jgi:hypothetical protein
MGKSKQEAIDFVTKNCYNAVTKAQVSDIIDLLQEFGMQPPVKEVRSVMEQGVSFKVPEYGWSKE